MQKFDCMENISKCACPKLNLSRYDDANVLSCNAIKIC